MPDVPGLIRVGHKGADHVAPGNTAASFEAALEHGVDMIEFDVLRARDGRLVLAHDYADSERRECLTLEEGLELFAGEAYAGVELDVDLKLPGYEREVVEGLARHGLSERSLVSTMYPESLDRLGELEPGLRRGWSVPRVQRNYLKAPFYVRLPALRAGRRACGRGMPSLAAAASAPGGCEAIMSHQILVSRPPRAGGARRRRPALRVDRRRGAEDPRARGARRGRRDHERPAAVRASRRRCRCPSSAWPSGPSRASSPPRRAAGRPRRPGGTFSAKVQPACCQVNSAEPASCHGEVALPDSGTQPSGLSHWAVKRTAIRSLEPSPASCARAPSWVGLQMFSFAHVDVS